MLGKSFSKIFDIFKINYNFVANLFKKKQKILVLLIDVYNKLDVLKYSNLNAKTRFKFSLLTIKYFKKY